MAADEETTGSRPVNSKYGLTSFISGNRPRLHVNLLTLPASITPSAQLRYFVFVTFWLAVTQTWAVKVFCLNQLELKKKNRVRDAQVGAMVEPCECFGASVW